MNKAIKIIQRNIPNGKIVKMIEYKNWYLFIVYIEDPYEGRMDGLYSVDKKTGGFCDFPYMKEGIFEEVMDLFEKAPIYKDVT